MTLTNVYIGALSEGPDPLDWGRDPNVGNTPGRLGPFFPPARANEFLVLTRKIDAGALPGKQVDWGAFAANVTKQEIAAFMDDLYKDDRTYVDPLYMPHLYPKLGELRAFVATLPEGRYALVAVEL